MGEYNRLRVDAKLNSVIQNCAMGLSFVINCYCGLSFCNVWKIIVTPIDCEPPKCRFPSLIYLEDFMDQVKGKRLHPSHYYKNQKRCMQGCSSWAIKHKCLACSFSIYIPTDMECVLHACTHVVLK